jgi:queuosine precursor transporter
MDNYRSGISRSLFFLSIFYGGMVCIAGVLGNKQVSLGPVSQIGTWLGTGPLAVEAGIFAFLLLVSVSSAVAELHGPETARRLVLFGFVPLITSVLLSVLVLALPPSPSMAADRLGAFELMMAGTPRIWLGGIVAYGISQILNVTIFSALKSGGGRYIWLRAAVASVLSQITDTLIFITVAFYGVFPIGELIAGQMLSKVVLSIVLVPALIYLFVALGRMLDGRRGLN